MIEAFLIATVLVSFMAIRSDESAEERKRHTFLCVGLCAHKESTATGSVVYPDGDAPFHATEPAPSAAESAEQDASGQP